MKAIIVNVDNTGKYAVNTVTQSDESADSYANGCKYCGFQEVSGKILVLESKYGKIVKIILDE